MWIALLTSLLIMLFTLGMERLEAALPRERAQPVDEPPTDPVVPAVILPAETGLVQQAA